MNNIKDRILYIVIILCLIFGIVYVKHVSYAGINENYLLTTPEDSNEYLFNKVKTLQEYAEAYITESGVSTSSGQLCMQYIRKDKYNTYIWQQMVGAVDSNFVSYVQSKDSTFSFDNDFIFDLNTGNKIDFIHMMATLNAYVNPNIYIDKSYAGWSGDLMTLLEEVVTYRITNNITDTNELQIYSNSLLGTSEESSFGSEDALADLDAINLSLYSDINTNLYQVLVDYYMNNTNENSSLNRFETAKVQLGNSKEIIKNEAKSKLSNTTIQTYLIPTVKDNITDSDLDILSTSFMEYVYREPYVILDKENISTYIDSVLRVSMQGRNLDNIKLSYDNNYVEVTIEDSSLNIRCLKYGNTTININSLDGVSKATAYIEIQNVAPSIKTDLQSSIDMSIGTNKNISFEANGTNNVYTWYLLNSTTDKGSVYKITNSPVITINPTNDMNGKYLKCEVSNEGNNSVYTSVIKLNVIDNTPVITKNLNSSIDMIINNDVTISFSISGDAKSYTWYLSDSSSSIGSVYKTTTEPKIKITPSINLNGKYLKCVVKGSNNKEVSTTSIKLNVRDEEPIIKTDLPTTLNTEIDKTETLSFEVTGKNNTYIWYLSDSTDTLGQEYKRTTTPSITFTPSEEMNGKYLVCSVINSDNVMVMSNYVKLSISSGNIVDTPDEDTTNVITTPNDESINDNVIDNNESNVKNEDDNNDKKINSLIFIVIGVLVIAVIGISIFLRKKSNNKKVIQDDSINTNNNSN